MNTSLSIVYDMTRRCPWNCSICCMGAVPGKEALIGELSWERKMALMDEIAQVNALRDTRVDFSGGEIFTDMRNVDVIARAAELLGREKVGISASGYCIDDAVARRLSGIISDCEMTMDAPPGESYPLRPDGYALAAARAVPHLRRYGIRTGIQTVLARSNCNSDTLTGIYHWLCENHVDDWSLLHFYPSGRGAAFLEERLTDEQECRAVDFIQRLDRENDAAVKPAVDFHYTMKGHSKYSSECRCVRKSVGILPDGTVTACFWAVDTNTGVSDPRYYLGSLRDSSLCDILTGDRAAYWTSCPHSCGLGVA
ncbi:MAG: radical SAM/SPASM domain-containing protein [Oscillospiraceae bacterium]